MQIPEYWAEARVVGKARGRQRVLRRFGWSDVDPGAAQRHADERAAAALTDWLAGKEVRARDHKVVYGGAEGLPIREEVVARQGVDVVTRNAYGARCLNQPDVLFADVDLVPRLPWPLAGLMYTLPWLAIAWGVVGSLQTSGACWKVLVVFGAFVLGIQKLVMFERLKNSAWNRRRLERAAWPRLRVRLQDVPGGRFVVYRTPAGLRVLVLHRLFEATGEAARQFLRTVDCDPTYAQMCRLQACFRARVSPKPWRIGMRRGLPGRSSTWPVRPVHRTARAAWVAEYEGQAAGYAACEFVAEVGDGPVQPRAAAVRRMHDELCRVGRGLPIA